MLSNITSKKVLKKVPNNPIAQNNPFKTGIFFIPLSIGGGFLSNTNAGVITEKQFEQDFDLFSFTEKIAEGQGDFQVNWRGALEAENKDEEVEWDNTKTTLTTYCELTYKVGYYGFGYQASYDLDFKVEQEASFNDFTSITDDDEITLLIKPEDLVGAIDFRRYRFYAFPFVFGHKVFYVSSCKTNINPNDSDKIVSYEVVFTNISNKLQKSGQSIEQYFHHNMAGNGYAWPSLDKENKRVLLDLDKLNSVGVNVIQEETYNACLQNNTAFIGWELVDYDYIETNNSGFVGDITNIKDNGDGTYKQRFYAPKLIFPCNFRSAEPTILTKRALPESDLSIINKVNFSEDNYEEWKKYWESYFSGDFSTKYTGEMEWKFRNDIYSYQKLNDTIDGLRLTFKGVASGYCKENIDTNGTALNWADANFYNYLTNKDIFTLPFSFTNHIINQPKQWPIIGAIWDSLTGGFPYGWDEKNRIISNERDMCFLTSATMLDISKKDWNTSTSKQDDKAFINTWYAKDSDDRFNANNRTLAFKYNLTSTIELKEELNYSKFYETSIIGQSYYWNNQYSDKEKQFLPIYRTTKEPFLIDGTQKLYTNLKYNNGRGIKGRVGRNFIICGISNQNCFGESQKFTMFNSYTPLWTNTFITNSTFRGTSRDWTNWYYTNFLNNLIVIGNTINYPKQSNKNGNIEGTIEYNINRVFGDFKGGEEKTYIQLIPTGIKKINEMSFKLPITKLDTSYNIGAFDLEYKNNNNFEITQHYNFDINRYNTKEKIMDYLNERLKTNNINFLFKNSLKVPLNQRIEVNIFTQGFSSSPNKEIIERINVNYSAGFHIVGNYDYLQSSGQFSNWLTGYTITDMFNDDLMPFSNLGKYQEGSLWGRNIISGLDDGSAANSYIRIYFDNLNLLTGDVDLRFVFTNFDLRQHFSFQAIPLTSQDKVFTNADVDKLSYLRNDIAFIINNISYTFKEIYYSCPNYLTLTLERMEIF